MYDSAGVRLSLIHSLPAVAEAAGVPINFLMSLGGLTTDALQESHRIVSRSQVYAIMHGLARRSGDATIGFQMANITNPAALGLMGVSLLSGRTLGESLSLQARFMPSLQRGVSIRLQKGNPRTQWIHRMHRSDPVQASLLNEGIAAFFVRTLRAISGNENARLHVILPHRQVVPLRYYEDALRCAVSFAPGDDLAIHFDTALLDNPNALRQDEGLSLDPTQIGAVPAEFALSDQELLLAIRRMFEAAALMGRLSLQEAAVMLGLSPRSLQRRLAAIGTTFEETLDGWRQQMALSILSEPDAKTMLTATRLGYTDASHFIRAFRRWTGVSPRDFRDERAGLV
ncbi:MAG: AraC family transcriptional regulator ligand-binding domain-containing protein [Tabrizicola sp.]|nr:AraC family transcriptional regulator ligand-binding domain-containing protein [Tabrizicola sp.]